MQRHELLISSIIAHAARHHGDGEIVSRRADGSLARTSYRGIEERARRLAAALQALGVKPGDRVGTLAMNSDRHMELYYAISGIGAVCNTINPRLLPDDIAYIVDHVEDGVIFCDPQFLALVTAIAPRVEALRAVVVLADAAPPADLPARVALYGYEDLLAEITAILEWPRFDENTASGLCYTSGTTGRPKGVLYSHRASLLHAMAINAADVVGLKATDRALAIVPMFHVNAWGLPYAAPIAGAALLMPGIHLDAPSLLALMNEERATVAVGVPTIWLNLLNHLRDTGAKPATLKRIVIGGAAMPRAMMQAFGEMGIRAIHGWGMTESSPLVSLNAPKPACLRLEGEAQSNRRCAQGRVVFGADVRAEDDAGNEVPWDGKSQGALAFRGHWIASGYYRMDPNGSDWFPTGDVGVIDRDGFITLTDRTKDLIKSGGEWISSIAIENIAVAHPDVAEAAAIAVPDEKWGERPLLIVVARPGCAPQPEALREFCRGKLPDWSLPDRVVVADSIPHGATGKILKTELRKIYAHQP
ncbi:MAG TPA: long-chain fatty acid--CoA ligase [Rhizomicrobium sp.]|jgi:fatty-acyl-CoA synthase|nr:long-chain fatty acid--CoA ligase [Rhizomicrobium sp.]